MRACIVRRDDRRGRIRTHAARVRAVVAIVAALVILRARERQDVLAIRHHDEARFLALQEFLDDDLIARRRRTARRTSRARWRWLRPTVSHDDHALARREPARLHDDGRALLLHVRRIEGLAREGGVGRRRNAVALEEFLGEGLGAFELRGLARGPEALEAARLERIDDAGDEWRLRGR